MGGNLTFTIKKKIGQFFSARDSRVMIKNLMDTHTNHLAHNSAPLYESNLCRCFPGVQLTRYNATAVSKGRKLESHQLSVILSPNIHDIDHMQILNIKQVIR